MHSDLAAAEAQAEKPKVGAASKAKSEALFLFRRLRESVTIRSKEKLLRFVIQGVSRALCMYGYHTARFMDMAWLLDPDNVTHTSYAYPHVKAIFSWSITGLVSLVVPLGIIFVSLTWIKDFGVSSGILTVCFAQSIGIVMVVLFKKFVGGCQPQILVKCMPVVVPRLAILTAKGEGFQSSMLMASDVCTTENEKDLSLAIESFPAGHTQIVFTGFGFLSIFLLKHLRLGYLRMVLGGLPILFAAFIAGSVLQDYQHYLRDVIFGAVLGMVVATIAHRTVYRAVVESYSQLIPIFQSEYGYQLKA